MLAGCGREPAGIEHLHKGADTGEILSHVHRSSLHSGSNPRAAGIVCGGAFASIMPFATVNRRITHLHLLNNNSPWSLSD